MRAPLAISLGLATGLALLLLQPPTAHAVDAGYVELWGGISQLSASDVMVNGSTAKLEYDHGFEGHMALGFEDRSLRIAFEAGYELQTLDSITIGGSSDTVDSDLTLHNFGGSIYYDIEAFEGIIPFFGGGVGVSLISLHNVNATVGTNTVKVTDTDLETALSFRGMLGLSHEVAGRWVVGAEYRLTYSPDPEISDSAGNTYKLQRLSHGFALGLRWRYWTPDGFGY